MYSKKSLKMIISLFSAMFLFLSSFTIPYADDQTTNIYEAENAGLTGGLSVHTSAIGYSGSGYITGYSSVGETAAFTVHVQAAGDYKVALRYANATGSAQTLSIYVNGTKIRQTTFSSRANWNIWDLKTETVSLNNGNNTITYQYDAGDSGNVKLDNMQIISPEEENVSLYSENFEEAQTVNDVQGITTPSPAAYSLISAGTRRYLKMAKNSSDDSAGFDLVFNPIKVKDFGNVANAINPGPKAVLTAQFDIKANEASSDNRAASINISGLNTDGEIKDAALLYHYGNAAAAKYTYGKPIPTISVPDGFENKYAIGQAASNQWYTVKIEIPVSNSSGDYISGQNNVNVYVNGVLSEIQNAPFISTWAGVIDRVRVREVNFYNTNPLNDTNQGFCIDNVSVGLNVNKAELAQKISEAMDLHGLAFANRGANPGQYDPSKTEALWDTKLYAEGIYNGSVSQIEVDNAITNLQTAINDCTINPTVAQQTATIYSNDFESYANSAALQADGFTHTVALSNITLATMTPSATPVPGSLPQSSKFAVIKSGAANGYGQVTFTPVALNANAGASLGKHVRLVAEYKIARRSFNNGNASWASFTDSTKAARSETIGAGTRMDTTPDPSNTALFRYASYIAGGNQPVTDVKNIYTAPSGVNTAAENNLWVKIKYVISITDRNGEYISSPTVDVYVNDSPAGVFDSAILNASDQIDALRICSSSSTGAIGIDDVNVYLTKDAAEQELLNIDFQNDTVYPNVNTIDAAQLTAAGWLIDRPDNNYGIVQNGASKYLKISSAVGESGADIKIMLPQKVRISNAGLPSGSSVQDPGHPGNNARLKFEYEMIIRDTGEKNRTSSFMIIPASGINPGDSYLRSAVELRYDVASPDLLYPLRYMGPNSNIIDEIDYNQWYKITVDIKITDGEGNYISKADIYLNDTLVLANQPFSYPVSNANVAIVDRFGISTKISGNGISSADTGIGIDNLKVIFSSY